MIVPDKLAPLGEILIGRGTISRFQLDTALRIRRRTGGRLGDILISEGIIGYRELYQAVASHYRLRYVNLLETPPAVELVQPNDIDIYLALGFVPHSRDGGNTVLACSEVTAEILRWAKSRYGEHFRLIITSPLDIRRSIEFAHSARLEADSRNGLTKQNPQLSAHQTVDPRQGMLACAIFTAGILSFWYLPHQAAAFFLLTCHALYGASMLFKWVLFTAGVKYSGNIHTLGRVLPMPDEHSLPVYTILVPLFKEANSLPRLMESLERIDYPAAKLDIKLVLEEDDAETYEAAIALKPSYHYEIIRVPPSLPRTKPKACNYALRFARGEYVCIFDAEDHPARLQLKRAVAAFRHAGDDVICLQARLNYYNANENWLTRFFTLEYTILFDFTLPGLQYFGMPIPLGGTSNHMNLAKLREIGGWDPYNVTEDADVGIRLYVAGYKTQMLDSYTLEEAPIGLMAWLRQRTRWIKGYMQTWLVHMRQPIMLYRRLGLRGFLGFQLFVGIACFTFLSAPLVWVLSAMWIAEGLFFDISVTTLIYLLALLNFVFYLIVHIGMAVQAARRHRSTLKHRLAIWALLYPLYPVLHSLASYRALWQLFFAPHSWEKTSHGLTKYWPNQKKDRIT